MMGFIWLRVPVNSDSLFFLCIMRDAAVLVGQLPVLQEGRFVKWMLRGLSINLWQGKVYCHLQSIETSTKGSLSSCSFVFRVKHLGQEGKRLSALCQG